MNNDKTLRNKLLQGVSGNELFAQALFKPPPTFAALMDGLRAAAGVKASFKSRSRQDIHTDSHPKRHRAYAVNSEALYTFRKMKYSPGNKGGDKFKPRPGYTRYILCKKPDCHSSRHSEEKQTASKERYFAARKAEGIKPTDRSFKAYLAYANRTGQDSEVVREKARE